MQLVFQWCFATSMRLAERLVLNLRLGDELGMVLLPDCVGQDVDFSDFDETLHAP